MATTKFYTPSEAAKLAGISASSARSYVKRYPTYFCSEAAPPKGQARGFVLEDVRLLRFIAQATKEGATHEEVAHLLSAGELEKFDWAPKLEPESPEEKEERSETTLTTMHQLQMIARLFDGQIAEHRQREEEARQREKELTQQLLKAHQQIGQLEGELGALKQANRPWWQRLFGRRSSSEVHNEKD